MTAFIRGGKFPAGGTDRQASIGERAGFALEAFPARASPPADARLGLRAHRRGTISLQSAHEPHPLPHTLLGPRALPALRPERPKAPATLARAVAQFWRRGRLRERPGAGPAGL